MQPTVSDGVMLVYNYAVVLSGWVMVTEFGIQDRTPLLAVSVFVAVVWTLYFRVSMRSRLLGEATEEA